LNPDVKAHRLPSMTQRKTSDAVNGSADFHNDSDGAHRCSAMHPEQAMKVDQQTYNRQRVDVQLHFLSKEGADHLEMQLRTRSERLSDQVWRTHLLASNGKERPICLRGSVNRLRVCGRNGYPTLT
jgi:hypothetical protein